MRNGADEKLPRGQHTRGTVYSEMLLQITRDYAGLPDIRTLTSAQIRFFYDGLRAELRKHTGSK